MVFQNVLESYGCVRIINRGSDVLPEYFVVFPELNEQEKNVVDNPYNIVKDYREVLKNIDSMASPKEKEEYVKNYLREQLNLAGIGVKNQDYLITAIMDQVFFGYGRLGPLIRDERLEEIMINGVESNVFVVHRKYGMCKTNIKFESKESLTEIIHWLSSYVGREINEERPLLDAHMPDGSRANVAIPPAAPYGPAITVRKFKKVPYNVIDLIKFGSLTTELTAFLWLCIEGLGIHPINMLISGGAGSGKTTLLNALAMFVPYTERIVTVEDTLELNFNFIDNWVPLEAMPAVLDVHTSRLDMEMLLKNALRMRPDRVIVGEVRGQEAETLMVAMDIGLKGSMGTIHANNARETTLRLMDEPMSVPLRMIPMIDIIVVMNRIFDRRRGLLRRVTQVAEITGIEGSVIQMGDIYKWDMQLDQISRTAYPILLLDKVAEACNIPKKRIQTELLVREKVLQYMVNKDIRDNNRVLDLFQKYHVSPQLVIDEIKKNEVKEQ
ncbi:MAG: CpaF family protein [Candidatus Altiarchaeales archaeon]|nr:CpaF family protein [Candidatus Altiarchaeales archaeon]